MPVIHPLSVTVAKEELVDAWTSYCTAPFTLFHETVFVVPAVSGGSGLSIGGLGRFAATLIEKAWAALEPALLLAVTDPVKVPIAVGVPEITPADESASPAGNAPALTENVGAGYPLAV